MRPIGDVHSEDLRPLTVYPLVSRVDSSEERLRELWRRGDSAEGIAGYQPAFEELMAQQYELADTSLEKYYDEVTVQHSPADAYGERVVVGSEVDDRLSIARSFEIFGSLLLREIEPWTFDRSVLSDILSDDDRRTPSKQDWDIYIAHAADVADVATALYQRLRRRWRVFLASESVGLGSNVNVAVFAAVSEAPLVVVIVSTESDGNWMKREDVFYASSTGRTRRDQRVVPIVVEDSEADPPLPLGLAIVRGLRVSRDDSFTEVEVSLDETLAALDRLPVRSRVNEDKIAGADLFEEYFDDLIQVAEAEYSRAAKSWFIPW